MLLILDQTLRRLAGSKHGLSPRRVHLSIRLCRTPIPNKSDL